ncbi:hypothetical protein Tco_1511895, partial [Tanacetum coccineum]
MRRFTKSISIVQTLLGYIDPATNDNSDASAMWIVRKKLPKEEERRREKEETERKVCLLSCILEADDDLELLKKLKQDRKKRFEKRQRYYEEDEASESLAANHNSNKNKPLCHLQHTTARKEETDHATLEELDQRWRPVTPIDPSVLETVAL